ncbi:hypothetical protein Dsin_027432 [Dipteronia sinensis]|uniref:Uncharacterized protein n=1 Tax=Dipteronia sinensis TaxID=43782 RepID=A0AAE0DTK1_9ROSI|nr:hypothetical protein Dsin_027432 [Dipteronia sinensis]
MDPHPSLNNPAAATENVPRFLCPHPMAMFRTTVSQIWSYKNNGEGSRIGGVENRVGLFVTLDTSLTLDPDNITTGVSSQVLGKEFVAARVHTSCRKKTTTFDENEQVVIVRETWVWFGYRGDWT